MQPGVGSGVARRERVSGTVDTHTTLFKTLPSKKALLEMSLLLMSELKSLQMGERQGGVDSFVNVIGYK